MTKKSIVFDGVYEDAGIIKIANGNSLVWSDLSSDEQVPKIPFGSHIQINISYDEVDYLNGKEGIVWATYSGFQADTISNALNVQNINNDVKKFELTTRIIHLINISSVDDVDKAVDFIWRGNGGLKLKPDWSYGANEENESFNKWIGTS
jgi:hypothetical protein